MAAPEPADSPSVPLRGNPFVGPLAFQREDAPRFFGRDDEAEELLALVISEKVVLFYAQSGAGKTSLISARLIPDLEREGFAVLPVARVGVEEVETPDVGNLYVFNALRYLSAREGGDVPRLAASSLPEFLALGADRPGRDAIPRVLIIDQFEEILTAYPERWQEREGFFRQLRQVLRDDPLLSLLLAMREDHIAGLDRYADLLPGSLHSRFRMERLRHPAALESVRRPVESRRPFAPGVAERLVDNLRQEHLADQEKRIAGEFVEPVQLQVVCYQLWEDLKSDPGDEITESHLTAFGNVDRALEGFYESAVVEVVARTPETEAKVRRWFGETLITPSRIRSQVNRGASKSGGLDNDAVDELVDAHLIRAERVRGGTWFELVHDRFIDPILASNHKWAARSRRRRLVAAVLAAVLLATVGLTWYLHRDRQARMARAEQDVQQALDVLTDHPPRSLWLALQAAKMARTVDRQLTPRTRDALRQALQESRARLVGNLPIGGEDHLLTLDGQGRRLSVLDPDGRVSVRDVESGRELLALLEGRSAVAAALSLDGTALAAALDGGTVQLWDVDSRQLHHDFLGEVEVIELALSPDGGRIAATTYQGTVEIWNVRSGNSIASLSDPDGLILVCTFAPEGDRLATASDTGMIAIWDLASGRRLHTFPGGDDNAVSFSPSGNNLASAGFDGVAVWDAGTGELPGLWLREESQIYSVAFSGGDRYAAFALIDGTTRIWDLEAIRSWVALPGDAELNLRPAFSQDGRRLAVSRPPGRTEVWELIIEMPGVLSGHLDRINALAVSRQGELLASGSDDHTARVWDLESGRLLETLRGHRKPVNGVAFSPQYRRLATAGDDHTARIWDLESGRLEQTLTGHANTVTGVAWSPEGTSIATASTDGTARLWDAGAGELQSTLRHPGEEVRTVAFSPDGRLLATAGGIAEEQGRARIWDPGSGVEIARIADHSDLINALAFSPDGELLATGSDDKMARIWELPAARLRQTLSGHVGLVTGVAFAPDGRRLATCDVTGTVILWDVESGDKVFTLPGPSPIYGLAFLPDGNRLVTGSRDARIRLELLKADDLIRLAEARTGVEPLVQVEN